MSGDVFIAGDGGEPMDHHSESTLMSETYLRGGEEAVGDVWGDGDGAGVRGELRDYNNESILRSESHHRGGEETVGDVGGDGEGGIYPGGGRFVGENDGRGGVPAVENIVHLPDYQSFALTLMVHNMNILLPTGMFILNECIF